MWLNGVCRCCLIANRPNVQLLAAEHAIIASYCPIGYAPSFDYSRFTEAGQETSIADAPIDMLFFGVCLFGGMCVDVCGYACACVWMCVFGSFSCVSADACVCLCVCVRVCVSVCAPGCV